MRTTPILGLAALLLASAFVLTPTASAGPGLCQPNDVHGISVYVCTEGRYLCGIYVNQGTWVICYNPLDRLP